MAAHDNALERLLLDVLEAHAPLASYFERAVDSGHTLASAFDAIEWLEETPGPGWVRLGDDEWDVEDPVLALIEHCGSVERAQSVLDETVRFRTTDASSWYARAAANEAIARRAPLDEIMKRVRAPALSDAAREQLSGSAAATCSLRALAELEPWDAHEERGISRVLQRRFDGLTAIDVLRDAGVDAGAVYETLRRFWGAPSSIETDPMLALLEVRAEFLGAASRPVRAAIATIEGERAIEQWLPVLRRCGLGATAAALHMHERVGGMPQAEIARVLRDTGYTDDEILRALLENGLSSSRTLRLLGDHGWSVDRMVVSLLGRATLLPEVRDHLLALGLPRPAIADVLLRHAAPELVALVLPGDAR